MTTDVTEGFPEIMLQAVVPGLTTADNTGKPYVYFCDSGFLNIAYGPYVDHVAAELTIGKVLFVIDDKFWDYFPDLSGVTNRPDVRIHSP